MTTIPVGTRIMQQTHPNHAGPTAFVVVKSGPKETQIVREVAHGCDPANTPRKIRTASAIANLEGLNPEGFTNPVSYTPANAVLDAEGYVVGTAPALDVGSRVEITAGDTAGKCGEIVGTQSGHFLVKRDGGPTDMHKPDELAPSASMKSLRGPGYTTRGPVPGDGYDGPRDVYSGARLDL